MADENKELNEVADVSSLINLCQRTDNLSAIQELALKQKVAFRFERVLHKYMYNQNKASAKFATYITLLESKPEVYGNVCDILMDGYVPEEVIEECLMYIRTGVVPYHLWTDKLISDITFSDFYSKGAVSGMLTVYLGKTLRASLIAYHKAIKALEEEQQLLSEDMLKGIEFIKARYMEIPQEHREAYMKAFAAENEESRRKFQDNETSIFTETLIDMLYCPFDQAALDKMMTGDSSPFDMFWVEPMGGVGAPIVSLAGGNVATASMDMNQQQEEKKPGMGSWVETIGYGPCGETPEEMERQRELAMRQTMLEQEKDWFYDDEQFQEYLHTVPVDEDRFYDDEPITLADFDTEDWDELENFEDEYTMEDVKVARMWQQKALHAKAEDMKHMREIMGIEQTPEKVTPQQEHVISNQNVQWQVKKVAKDGSNRVMSTNWFDTEAQAKEFVREVTEENPAMARAFDFKIEPGTRP